MTRPNEQESQNTLMAWATSYSVIYAIGIAAGIFIWRSGLIQTTTSKLFRKKESE